MQYVDKMFLNTMFLSKNMLTRPGNFPNLSLNVLSDHVLIKRINYDVSYKVTKKAPQFFAVFKTQPCL